MTTDSTQEPKQTFADLGVDASIVTVLKKVGIEFPSPIQHAALPVGLKGQDVVGIAQTGTGKTLAFGIPMLTSLKTKGGRALVVVPTRELAQQVEDSLKPLCNALGIGTAVFVGGQAMGIQRGMIRRNPRILIATPGRLIDHLEQRTITLREVTVLVLDEADRMLDMGFAPQVNKILAAVPPNRQTMLFSATMPHAIMSIASKHMKLPVNIEVAPQGTTAERVEQAMIVVQKEKRLELLQSLLNDYKGLVLVFSRTKHGAKKLTASLKAMGHKVAEIHANKTLAQRKEALSGFKLGRYRILIATDIAARGIDVNNIELVVNFDLPDNPEEYVHRIGRTGRAGKAGQAVSFATPDQRGSMKEIERLIRATIPTTHLHPFQADAAPARHRRGGGGGGSYGGRGGGRSFGGRGGGGGGGRSFRRR